MDVLVVSQPGSTEVRRVDIPQPGPGEVLVKTSAIALNPSDWVHRDMLSPSGAWLGTDFSGVVHPLGAGVSTLKAGDRVASMVHGGLARGEGAFAEYVKVEEEMAWKVPEGMGDAEAAASAGCGPWTAVQALYFRLGLKPPHDPTIGAEPVLVWGASTSVGLYAVQLLKVSGYTVIATASEKNFALLKELGVSSVYSYADPSTPSRIASDHPTLSYALDCIAQHGATANVAQAIKGAGGKGRIITLQPVAPEEVAVEGVKHEFTMVYTCLGVPVKMGPFEMPAMPEDKRRIKEWLSVHLPALFASGKLRANPLWEQEGGLERVHEGLELLKGGKVSAQKVVYRL
ncbi:hypothetical protein JCM6882_003787 [Rhodosporidiobolus microsporus]